MIRSKGVRGRRRSGRGAVTLVILFVDCFDPASGEASLTASTESENVWSTTVLISGTSEALEESPPLDEGSVDGGDGSSVSTTELEASSSDSAGTGRSADAIAEPPRIEKFSIPPASFNAPYDVTFNAQGGEGWLTFFVDDGALPRGLALDIGGRLRGVPEESGDFSFTVVVTDTAGQSDSLSVELIVARKRWLAYTSSEGTDEQNQLYLVDLSTARLDTVRISPDLQEGETVRDFRFSPDGDQLAFTVEMTTSETRSLYLLDVSDEAPGTPRLISEGLVDDYDISPDGRRIAYSLEDASGVHQLYLADVLGETSPEYVADSLGSGDSVLWVENDFLFVRLSDGGRASVFCDDESCSPLELVDEAVEGFVWAVDPVHRRVIVGNHVAPSTYYSYILNLEEGSATRVPSDGYSCVFYNSQATYVAESDADSSSIFIYPTGATSVEPIGVISPSVCTVFWFPGGEAVVTQDPESPGLLYTSITSEGLLSEEIVGDYDYSVYGFNPVFLSDERFVFAGTSAIFDVRRVNGTFQEVRRIDAALEGDSSLGGLWGAPNGSWVVFLERQYGTDEVTVVNAIDVREDDPGRPRMLRTLREHRVSEMAFSADSSALAFFASSEARLYVVDMMHETAAARGIASALGRFEFQP